MNPTNCYRARWIGHLASLPGTGEADVRVLGATSRGVFLLGPAGQVLFLSYEAYAGPLSINLEALPGGGRLEAQAGQSARLSAEAIQLAGGQRISLAGAQRWQPAALPAARAMPAERRECLVQTARLALAHRPDAGLMPFLAQALGLRSVQPPAWQQPFAQAWQTLARSPAAAQPALEALLGLGGGLTPSGDDFLAGLLLGLNRLAHGEAPPYARALSQALVQAARGSTNALSAALIAAAAQASADERLLTAWDGLQCGTLAPQSIYEQLAGYGNSSGLDALAGFAAACRLDG